MMIAKTKCQLCQTEKDLTKSELIDLIEDCDSKERLISFVTGIKTKKEEVTVPVMCSKCANEMSMKRQNA